MSVKLCRVPHEHITLPMRVQDRLVPRPGSTIVLVSDGYARLEEPRCSLSWSYLLPMKTRMSKVYGGGRYPLRDIVKPKQEGIIAV